MTLTILLRLGAVASALLLIPPDTAEALLATAASTLFEGMAVILAVDLAKNAVPRRWSHAAAALACGCGGPSARSIAGAVLVAVAVSPPLAALRFVAAWLVPGAHHNGHGSSAGAELHALLPAACLTAVASYALPRLQSIHFQPAASFAAGAAAGVVLAPCGIGAAALLASFARASPMLAAGYASTAGIVAVRWPVAHRRCDDRATYATLAAAAALVVLRNGGALVHPIVATVLAPATIVLLHRAYRATAACAIPSAAALLMLAAALMPAPQPPSPAVDAASMQILYEGERVAFTGVYGFANGRATLVRYRITCCRADAAPVAIRLSRVLRARPGDWVTVAGTAHGAGGGYCVEPASAVQVAPPADPFVYL